MPHYQFIHRTPLTTAQIDQIAREVTDLHCQIFPLTPKFFVNVFFRPSDDEAAYCGGRRVSFSYLPESYVDRMVGHVRVNNSRPQELFNTLAGGIAEIWESVVGGSAETEKQSKAGDIRIWIIGAILSGKEGGLYLPQAGEEPEWIQTILPDVRRRAEAGEDDYMAMLEDIEARGLDKRS